MIYVSHQQYGMWFGLYQKEKKKKESYMAFGFSITNKKIVIQGKCLS